MQSIYIKNLLKYLHINFIMFIFAKNLIRYTMEKFKKVSMMVRVTPETRKIMEEERLDTGQSFGQLVDNWAKIVTNPKVWDFILSSVEKSGEKLKNEENGKDSSIIL